MNYCYFMRMTFGALQLETMTPIRKYISERFLRVGDIF
jgi:hypothetical protein